MPETTAEIDLSHPDFYINREMSLLEFNRRVLSMAEDESIPLLERLMYLCIASTNLDEFFEVRVALTQQKARYGSVQSGPDNWSPPETLNHISEEAHKLVEDQYQVLNKVLIPALREQKIRMLRRDEWRPTIQSWVKSYFNREVLPVLSPIGLDPSHPFPRILNKSLNFIISLEGKDAFGRDSGLAIVQAPRSLPRIIHVPKEHSSRGYNDFVFLSSIIHTHVSDLFPGMKATGCYQFRVTRDSQLSVDDEMIDDLLHAIEGELPSRRFSNAVRLEVADNCPQQLSDFLLKEFNLDESQLYQVNGPVNLGRLSMIRELVERPELKFPGFHPRTQKRLQQSSNIFDTIRKGDLLFHHPFDSFGPVIDLIRQASSDPCVLSIKQTLYRTGSDSAVVKALCDAARSGKEVTVVIELRARFDEEANIELANVLHQAGAQVVYGVVGYKTHAKMLLVIRREGRTLRRYIHLGTGNYHERTARMYTDYGLMTCDRQFGEDANKMFHQLTGLGKATKLKKLLQSPFTFHKGILDLINAEIENAKAGYKAHIIAKMNSLTEEQTIRALYTASQAGVKIDLIVRGICCLKPGIAGVSENITVRSIIGRFLEHTRVFYFHANGEETVLLSSADWMQRNFSNRVEISFPVDDTKLHNQIIKTGLLNYLSDNTQSWRLQADGSYRRNKPGNAKPKSAQQQLLSACCG